VKLFSGICSYFCFGCYMWFAGVVCSGDFGLVDLLVFWDSLCCFGVCCFCCFGGLCILRLGFCGVCVGIIRKLVCLLLW